MCTNPLVRVLCLALLATLALLAAPPVGEGQQSKAIPRLCFLTLEPSTLQTRSPRFDAFFQTLRELGYVDGQSIIIDYMSAADHSERFPDLVAECLRRKADIIVPSTTPAAQAAKARYEYGPDCHDCARRPGGDRAGQ